jgi:hypothetical protein
MVVDESAQEQPRELVANRLAQADDTGRPRLLAAVLASAVLEEESESTA